MLLEVWGGGECAAHRSKGCPGGRTVLAEGCPGCSSSHGLDIRTVRALSEQLLKLTL